MKDREEISGIRLGICELLLTGLDATETGFWRTGSLPFSDGVNGVSDY